MKLSLFVALSTMALAPAALAQRLVAVDSSRVLYDVNPDTGEKIAFGNVSDNAGTTGGLARDEANDIIYLTSTSLDSLFTLDLDTGQATLVGPYGDSAIVMHGLEFDPTTDTLYGVSSHNNGLYDINTSNGSATLIGTSGLSSFTNLGYDSTNDIMWATNSGSDSFYRMDRSNGSTTLIGPLNGSTNPNGVAYRPDNDRLYVVDNSQDNLYWIDRNTGTANVIGSTGSGNLLGLLWIPDNLVLTLSGECPGTITVQWSGASINRGLGIVFASNQGSYRIPNDPCGGTTLGLGTQNLQLVISTRTGIGSGEIRGHAGPSACRGFLQLVVLDGNPCTTSNVEQLP